MGSGRLSRLSARYATRWIADNVNNRWTRQPARALFATPPPPPEEGSDGPYRKEARRAPRPGASPRAHRPRRAAWPDRRPDRVARRRAPDEGAREDPDRAEYGREAEGHRADPGNAGRGARRPGDRPDGDAVPRESRSQEAGRAFTAFPSSAKSGRASIEAPAHQRRASSRRSSWKWRCG